MLRTNSHCRSLNSGDKTGYFGGWGVDDSLTTAKETRSRATSSAGRTVARRGGGRSDSEQRYE